MFNDEKGHTEKGTVLILEHRTWGYIVKCRHAKCHSVITTPIDQKYKYLLKYMGMKYRIVAVNTKIVVRFLLSLKIVFESMHFPTVWESEAPYWAHSSILSLGRLLRHWELRLCLWNSSLRAICLSSSWSHLHHRTLDDLGTCPGAREMRAVFQCL